MFLGIFCTMAGWVESEHPSTGWENRAELGMRVQACCVQRVKRWAFAINDAFFFVLRGSLLRKGPAESPKHSPGLMSLGCVALRTARWKERVNRCQGAGCAATISAMWDKNPAGPPPPFASIFSETLVWLISLIHAKLQTKGKKSRRQYYDFFFPF